MEHAVADPYARFESKELILRDELAIDRTLLANERTLLSYLRSGLALLIAGISIIHFASGGWFMYVGIACIPLGVVTALIGLVRYRRMDAMIMTTRRSLDRTSAALAATLDAE